MGQLSPARAVVIAVNTSAAPSQYRIFALDREMFVVGILTVKEIIDCATLATMPMLPAFIRGVINRNGCRVPVIDLSTRLGGRPIEVGQHTRIIIAELHDDEGSHDIGIMTEISAEAIAIPGDAVWWPPGAALATDFLFGVGKIAGKRAIIANIDELLSAEDIALLSRSDVLSTSVANAAAH